MILTSEFQFPVEVKKYIHEKHNLACREDTTRMAYIRLRAAGE